MCFDDGRHSRTLSVGFNGANDQDSGLGASSDPPRKRPEIVLNLASFGLASSICPASFDLVKLLFLGDIVGEPGRRVVRTLLPRILKQLDVQFVVANG